MFYLTVLSTNRPVFVRNMSLSNFVLKKLITKPSFSVSLFVKVFFFNASSETRKNKRHTHLKWENTYKKVVG